MATAIRSSPASVALTAMISCLARAAYTGQFGAWDPATLHSMETPLNTIFRRLSCLLPTSATHLLYMPPTLGGMSFPSLYDYIQQRKWTMVHRSLNMKSTAAQAMGGLLNRAARSGGYPTRPGAAYPCLLNNQHPTHITWGSSLGTLASDAYARLSSGIPMAGLDLPVIPLSEQTRATARRLRELGPLLWGDLTSGAQELRTWIPEAAFHRLRLPILYPTTPCPQGPYINCCGGIIFLHRLGKQGRVITDNQGIVKQLLDRKRMTRSGSRQGTSIAVPAWDILQEGQITLHWHRGHPERRGKTRTAWSRDDLGSYLANLYAPPRADLSPTHSPTRIKHVILTDRAAFRQQLIPHTRWQLCDHQDEAVLNTLNARVALARSRTPVHT